MRDKQIDLLRFIGLSFLILGHVDPPGWLFQLRNFNVALVIIASAMAVAHSPFKEDYPSYLWKRVKRLAFPAWIFLTFYFAFLGLTGIDPHKVTPEWIWYNYTFSNAGGYMWIIRIFLLVALVAPLIYQINQKIELNKRYLTLLLSTYVVYECVLYLLDQFPFTIWTDFLVAFIGYAVGYGIVFGLGLRLSRLTSGETGMVAGFLFFVFAFTCAVLYFQNGHLVSTQGYKYPPSMYYLSYAVGMSIVFWKCSGTICGWLKKCAPVEKVVMFIAANSLWIYLWHTLFIQITYRMHHQGFLAKYFVVYSTAALMTYIQVTAVHKVLMPRMKDDAARKNLKTLLTG